MTPTHWLPSAGSSPISASCLLGSRCRNSLQSSSKRSATNGSSPRKRLTSVPCFGDAYSTRTFTWLRPAVGSSYSTSAAFRGATATSFLGMFVLFHPRVWCVDHAAPASLPGGLSRDVSTLVHLPPAAC